MLFNSVFSPKVLPLLFLNGLISPLSKSEYLNSKPNTFGLTPAYTTCDKTDLKKGLVPWLSMESFYGNVHYYDIIRCHDDNLRWQWDEMGQTIKSDG